MVKVDLVDENDNIIGVEDSKIVHEKLLLHRVSMVFIFKDATKKQLLLQLRSRNKTVAGGKWGLTGGHVESGETYEEGIIREYKEELFNGKDINISISPLFKVMKNTNGCHSFVHAFEGIYSGDFDLQKEEVEKVEYFDIEYLKKDILENPDKYALSLIIVLRKYFNI